MGVPSAHVPARSTNRLTYLFGALGGLLFGYDLGVVAGALLFLTPDLGLTPFQKGLVTSSLLLGAMVGALGCGPASDRLGRRIVVLLAGAIFAVGAIGAALAPGSAVIILFRFVMGLAVGTVSVTVPIYLSELAPPELRGRLSGLNQLMISSGILLAYLVNLALGPFEAWRWMFGLAAIPAALLMVGVYFQPESPRWLIKKGREAEARHVLQGSRDEATTESEISEIKNLNRQEQQRVRLSQLLRTSGLRRILIVGLGLAVFQQIMGINTIIYYAPTIFTDLGFGNASALRINAGLGVWTLLVTVVMILFVVDKVGRKKPLMFGALGQLLCMASLAIAFVLGGAGGGAAGWVAIAVFVLFKAVYALSWGGIMWIMLGEIFPLRVRGAAMGIATFGNWLGNFLVAQFFPVLEEAAGAAVVFTIFAVIAAAAFFFALLLVPETKGRSLESIEVKLVLGSKS